MPWRLITALISCFLISAGMCGPESSTKSGDKSFSSSTDNPGFPMSQPTTQNTHLQMDQQITPTIPLTINKSQQRLPVVRTNLPRVEIPFLIAMWVFSASLLKIGINFLPKSASIVPESCWLILFGIVSGFVLFHTDIKLLSPLSSTIFFFCMLPPIILDAGYFMPNRLFFDHLGTILLFAIAGTVFNTFAIGLSLWACGLTGIYGFQIPLLETLLFSSLISAVDPVAVLAVFEEIHVDQVLYIIVFGESLLNDAVSVVLYNMFDGYITLGPENIITQDVFAGMTSFVVVAVGGTTIGITWGFLTGFMTKFTHRVPMIEPVFVFVMSYLAYVNAEAVQMSGILSITFCGIAMKNYVEANISRKSHTTLKYAIKMLSHCSEAIIFVFLGISTVHDQHCWNTAFILLTILFCSIFRAIGVVILTEMANYFRLHQLDRVEKFVMSYGGLRGAIAFALVLQVDPKRISSQPLFVTATISVVYFTVFFQGITIKPLVNFLKVKREEKRRKTMNERVHERFIDYTMAGVEDILGRVGNFKIRDEFKKMDQRFIRPLIVRETKSCEPKILETYSRLTMIDAAEFASRNPSAIWNSRTPPAASFAALLKNYTFTSVRSDDIRIGIEEPAGFWRPSRRTAHRMPHKCYDLFGSSQQALSGYELSCNPFSQKVRSKTAVAGSIHKHKVHSNRTLRNRKNPKAGGAVGLSQKLIQEEFAEDLGGDISVVNLNSPESPIDDQDDGGVTFTVHPHSSISDVSTAGVPFEIPLPWKSVDPSAFPLRQSEFPSWVNNKDYTEHKSPTVTFLGNLGKKEPARPTVFELFSCSSDSSPSSTVFRSRRDSFSPSSDTE